MNLYKDTHYSEYCTDSSRMSILYWKLSDNKFRKSVMLNACIFKMHILAIPGLIGYIYWGNCMIDLRL